MFLLELTILIVRNYGNNDYKDLEIDLNNLFNGTRGTLTPSRHFHSIIEK
jgi:hypothetical protein